MIIKWIFLWIYRLDYLEAMVLLVTAVYAWRMLAGRICSAGLRRGLAVAALLLWMSAVVWQTLGGRSLQAYPPPVWRPFQSYTDALGEGGQMELLRSNFMNSVLFFPGGFLLAEVLPGRRRIWWKAIAAVLLWGVFSVSIEWAQLYYGLGLVQTDDVIHNVLGALVGAAAALTPWGRIFRISEDEYGT